MARLHISNLILQLLLSSYKSWTGMTVRVIRVGVLHHLLGSWKGRENQYIQLVKVLYCKVLTKVKQLPAFHTGSSQDLNSDVRVGRQVCCNCSPVASTAKVRLVYGRSSIGIRYTTPK